MKKVLSSSILIGIVGLTAFGLSSAFFSDTETSTDNTFTAGELDLKIDNTSYLNGTLHEGTTWGFNDPLGLFFNFLDLKPGDEGEDTISLHLDDNDAWVCADISLTSNDDNTCTDEEQSDDTSCSESDNNFLDGELAQSLQFIFWVDDGDNVLEEGEYPDKLLQEGDALTVLDSLTWTLADSDENNVGGSTGDPLLGEADYFIGKAWCFGTLTPNPVPDGEGGDPTIDSGVLCDGSQLDNATQTDKVTADISFLAVQYRNNPDFQCSVNEANGTFEYFQPDYFFTFDAKEPSGGEAWNFTPDGSYYHANIGCVDIQTNVAFFAAEIDNTNNGSFGPWVLIKVLDAGLPGPAGDKIWGQFVDAATAATWCTSPSDPTGGPWSLLNGNLTVNE